MRIDASRLVRWVDFDILIIKFAQIDSVTLYSKEASDRVIQHCKEFQRDETE